MSFSSSGGVITQTGTDTNLTGLSGLTGVTVDTTSVLNEYTLDNTVLVINGTLSFNAFDEALRFINVSATNKELINIDGTLTVTATDLNGNIWKTKTAIDLGVVHGSSNPALNVARRFRVGPTGSATLSGQYLSSAIGAGPFIYVNYGGTLIFQDATIIHNTIGNYQVRCDNGGDLQFIRTDIVGINAAIGSVGGAAGTITQVSDSGFFSNTEALALNISNGFAEVNNLNFANLSNQVARINAASGNTHIKLNDPESGGNVKTKNQQGAAQNNRFFVESNVTFNILDEYNNAFSSNYYSKDVDNGNRGSSFTANSIVYTPANDQILSGSGSSPTTTFISAFKNENNTTDWRGEGATGDLLFYFYKYGRQFSTSKPNTTIKGAKTATVIQLPNLSITEATKTTVDAYTTLDTAEELYDRHASFLEDNLGTYLDFFLSKSGAQIELTDQTLIIDSAAVAAFAYSSPTVTIKSATFTGGATATTGTVTTTNGTLLSGGSFGCDLSYDSGAGTTLTNVTCTGVMDFTTAGTYTISGGTIAEVTNSSGGAVILNLEGVAVVTTNTGPNITVNAATATLSFVNMTASTVEIFDDSGITVSRVSAQSSPYTYQPPAGSTGSWSFVADRVGYAPLRGSFSATGDNATLDVDISQLLKSDNTPQYSGGTYPLITVVYDFVTTCMCINIADGIATCQQIMDASEDALLTVNGMRWQKEQNSLVRFDNLPGVGNILFFGTNIRVKRTSAGDVNSGVSGYISSIDGVVVDGANGGVSYIGGIDISALALEATLTTKASQSSVDLKSSQSSVDALPSAVPSATENADAVWAKTI